MLTSTKTGTRLFCIIGATVVGKQAAVVITSSHGFNCLSPSLEEVNDVIASRFADEPEFVRMQCFTPRNSEKLFSNSFAYLPGREFCFFPERKSDVLVNAQRVEQSPELKNNAQPVLEFFKFLPS